MNSKIHKNGIAVDGGWTIDANVFLNGMDAMENLPFDNTLLFSGVNHITGKTISITYENATVGYSLDYCSLTRQAGTWVNDDNNNVYETLLTGFDISSICALLLQYLNQSGKKLVPLMISSWTILYNNLVENVVPACNDLLFSAVRGKLFIDVSYQKKKGEYYVFLGMAKRAYGEMDYNLGKPTTESVELSIKDINELKMLIDGLLVNWGQYFYQAVRQAHK